MHLFHFKISINSFIFSSQCHAESADKDDVRLMGSVLHRMLQQWFVEDSTGALSAEEAAETFDTDLPADILLTVRLG